jgi:hypothetical protein
MLRAIIVAASIGVATYGLSQTNSVDALVAHPEHWNGRHVKIAGTISGIEERTAIDGRAYDVFMLCNRSCVRVFTDARPKLSNGRRLTVEGTFSSAERLGEIQLQNDVQADSE